MATDNTISHAERCERARRRYTFRPVPLEPGFYQLQAAAVLGFTPTQARCLYLKMIETAPVPPDADSRLPLGGFSQMTVQGQNTQAYVHFNSWAGHTRARCEILSRGEKRLKVRLLEDGVGRRKGDVMYPPPHAVSEEVRSAP